LASQAAGDLARDADLLADDRLAAGEGVASASV